MKKTAFLLFFIVISFIFSSYVNLSAQTINEKLIAAIPPANGSVDAYSMKYDTRTGAWVFGSYDTTAMKYTIITPLGSSQQFTYAMQYNSIFDESGNVYTIANDMINDTVYMYYIVKNRDVIGTYDFLNEGWAENNGVIYFSARTEGKEYLMNYDTKSGSFSKGKAYDQVRLVYNQAEYSEGEPVGFIGFTKEGSPYYVAVENDEVFLVIGAEEQKHYSDISWYDVKFDGSGTPCYIAKSEGKFYDERGNTFVVQGTKEYKSFDWIYGPLVFDSGNNPVYVGQDSTGEYKYRSTIMSGANAVKTLDGNIYNYLFSPSGKLAYVASTDYESGIGEYVYQNRLIYDGKEGKVYNSVANVQFTSGVPVYIASDKNNKYFVVKGASAITEKYDYIADFRLLPDGRFAYVGTKYGNYEKKIPDKNYVYIEGEKYGPYDIVSTSDWVTNTLVLGDKKGNYAYLTGKNTDRENYLYKYKVYTNKWKSKAFDNISEVNIINGKVIYFAGNQIKKDVYIYNYRLYVNNKPLGDSYSAFTDLEVDDAGTMTFIASKSNNMYRVEVKP